MVGVILVLLALVGQVDGRSSAGRKERKLDWFGSLSDLDHPAQIVIRSTGFEGRVSLRGTLSYVLGLSNEEEERSETFDVSEGEAILLMIPGRKLLNPTTFRFTITTGQADAPANRGSMELFVQQGGRFAVLKPKEFKPLPETLAIDCKTGGLIFLNLPKAAWESLGFIPEGWTLQVRREKLPEDTKGLVEQLFGVWPIDATVSWYPFSGVAGMSKEIRISVRENGYNVSPVCDEKEVFRPSVRVKGFTLVLQRLLPITEEKKGSDKGKEAQKKS